MLASAAGVPVARSVSSMSVRCAPSAVVPAAASRARLAASPARSQSSTASAGSTPPADRRSGRPGRSGPAGIAPRARLPACGVQPGHQGHPGGGGGDSVAGDGILQAGQPGAVLARPSASRRLRLPTAVSCAAISRAWPGSSAQTSRSRKRRRPDRPSWNNRSICGVSQTAATRRAMSAWLRGAAPSSRNTRRSASRLRQPVPMSGLALLRLQPRRDRPAAGAVLARQVGAAGTAQAAAGNQQRQRLQQVGLAAAVRAVQHADPRRRAPGQRGIVAEVGQR